MIPTSLSSEVWLIFLIECQLHMHIHMSRVHKGKSMKLQLEPMEWAEFTMCTIKRSFTPGKVVIKINLIMLFVRDKTANTMS